MKINEEGVKLVIDFEGFNSKPYLDVVGVPTIGYGSTFYEDGKRVTLLDNPIDKIRATALMTFELNQVAATISKYIKVSVTSNQFSALTSFAYNVGVGNFSKSTLLKKINSKDFIGAADQFLVWNKAGGKVFAGLTRRRVAERLLFLK